jgi:hypothetical protein
MGRLVRSIAASGVLSLGTLAVACADPPVAPLELDARVVTADVWSGAEATVVIPQLRLLPALPVARLGDEILTVIRADDTTLVVRLPDRPGTHYLQIESPLDTGQAGPLRLHGYLNRFAGAEVKGVLRVWPGGGAPLVLGVGPSGLLHWDLRGSSAQPWPDAAHDPTCNWSVGASYRPNHVVLQDRASDGTCGPLRSWQIHPVLESREPGYLPYAYGWGIAELSDGIWLVTRDDFYDLANCRDGTCRATRVWYGAATDPVLSPRGDRAALDGGFPSLFPWVLDAATGEEAYRVRRLYIGYGSVFTPEGDTLYMVGADTVSGTTELVALRATDGLEFSSMVLDTLAHWGSVGLALDPVEPRLYVAGTSSLGPALLVIERGSFTLAATLQAIAEPASSGACPVPVVVPAPSEGHIYMVCSYHSYDAPSAPVPVFRFERLP